MSPSNFPGDDANADVLAAAGLLDRLVDDAAFASVSDAALGRVIGAVLRLYEGACVQAQREIPPVGSDVSTTAAVTMACALARSQSLTAFDLALWFSHTAPRHSNAPFETAVVPVPDGGRHE
jgi:hypothetical protein